MDIHEYQAKALLAGFGIPTTGLILILGVDRILDMSRTVVNVTGDLTACVLIRGSGKAPAKTASPQPAAG